MPQLIVTTSSNISILNTSVVTDLCAGVFLIDLKPSTFIGVGANNALGAKVRITNPYDVAIKDYSTDYDILPPFDGVFSFNISTNSGNYEYGEFIIDVQVTDSDNKTYTVTKKVKPCYPDIENKNRKYGSLGATIKGVCRENKVYVSVDSLPTYNGLLSSAVTQSFNFEYPTGSSLPKATRTLSYFSDYLFEGVYKLEGEICATYNDDDNISYRVNYKVSAKKEVLCQIDDCAVFANFKALHNKLDDCNEKDAVNIGNTMLEALGLYTTAKLANDCGEDASDYILRLQDLLGCKCTCDFSEAPISNSTPAKDVVIDGCNIIEENNGLTTHYKIYNYSYVVDVAPNGGFLAVAAPQLTDCIYKQTLTFDVAKVYGQMKTYANATMDEAYFWASIVNKAASADTPPEGTSQEAWGGMSYSERLQTIITRLNAAVAAIGNIHVADPYVAPTFNNGVALDVAGKQVGLGGSLIRNTSIGGAFYLALTQAAVGIGRVPTMQFDVFTQGGIFGFNGKQAIISDISANIPIGEKAAQQISGGSGIIMGYQAAYAAIANYHIAMGYSAGFTVKGDDGIYMGRLAGFSTDGNRNVMIGALSGYNTNSQEGTFVGYGTGAGDPIIDQVIPNGSFVLNDERITGMADFITQAGLSVGDRIAISLSESNLQIGGQPMPGGGQSFKGVVFDTNNFKMLYNGVFTNSGTGTTRIRVYVKTINVTAIGRNARANQNNQVALGDEFTTTLKLGGRVILRINDLAISLPRVTTVEKNSLTALIGGEIVYDVTANKVAVYDKSGVGQWKFLAYEA